jgi:hypothetical protein
MRDFIAALPPRIAVRKALYQYRAETGSTICYLRFVVELMRAGAKFHNNYIVRG